MATRVSIDLTKSPQLVSCFDQLLLRGVALTTTAGITVRSFLCDRIGIDTDYLETSIQTIFLNGKAVDEIDKAMVHQGAVLALSAAMPGLAGAVLRSKGILRGLRREISLDTQAAAQDAGPIEVTLKLFNSVLRDLGSRLLSQGVIVTGKDLLELLTGCRQELMDGGATLLFDGRPAKWAALDGDGCTDRSVRFQIVIRGNRPMTLHVQIKLFATLNRFQPADAEHYPIAPGTCVAELPKALGIAADLIKLVFVNGVRAEAFQVLQDGDRIGLFPPVGGG